MWAFLPASMQCTPQSRPGNGLQRGISKSGSMAPPFPDLKKDIKLELMLETPQATTRPAAPGQGTVPSAHFLTCGGTGFEKSKVISVLSSSICLSHVPSPAGSIRLCRHGALGGGWELFAFRPQQRPHDHTLHPSSGSCSCHFQNQADRHLPALLRDTGTNWPACPLREPSGSSAASPLGV